MSLPTGLSISAPISHITPRRFECISESLESSGVRIIPGMPAQVFIKTGRGTVALYALRPLLDSFNNAFRED